MKRAGSMFYLFVFVTDYSNHTKLQSPQSHCNSPYVACNRKIFMIEITIMLL